MLIFEWLRNAWARATAPRTFPDEWQLMRGLEIVDGWLYGDNVVRIPSHPSWYYAKLDTEHGEPEGVVWHYSATNWGTAANMAKTRTQPWSEFAKTWKKYHPGKPVPQTSWHVSVEADGTIVQMAPFTAGCWHAGGPTAKKIPGLGWANRTTAGIELIGHGKEFPDPQVRAAAQVLAALVDHYEILRTFAGITHASIDPGRKADPGPVWAKRHAAHVLEYAYSI